MQDYDIPMTKDARIDYLLWGLCRLYTKTRRYPKEAYEFKSLIGQILALWHHIDLSKHYVDCQEISRSLNALQNLYDNGTRTEDRKNQFLWYSKLCCNHLKEIVNIE